MAKKKAPASDKVLHELRAFGLAYPGAHTKSPWPGHLDLAVNDKTFAYLSIEGEPFGISCKLPESSEVALLLPFCKPTEYGLGRSGWVTAQFPEDKVLPVDMLKQWIDESYRAQAPKKLLKQLTMPPAESDAKPAKKPAAKKPAAKKPAAKKPAKKSVAKKAAAKTARR
ncbi:MAG: MmcQ/YjbR family DNA-binding protein [Kofleriaceae bacterium]|nr:MmcQ/YjbR family DNA-binding protein [Kofleriaceae bacterium]